MLLFSHPVMSDSLRPHELQDTRPPCPSPSSEVCPSSCPLHQWCHPAILSPNTLFSFCFQSFPASGTFPVNQLFISGDQNTGASASATIHEYSGFFFFFVQIDWFDLLAVQGTLRSLLQFKGINSLALCLFYSSALTSICDHWEDYNLDYTDLCQQGNVSAFQHTV